MKTLFYEFYSSIIYWLLQDLPMISCGLMQLELDLNSRPQHWWKTHGSMRHASALVMNFEGQPEILSHAQKWRECWNSWGTAVLHFESLFTEWRKIGMHELLISKWKVLTPKTLLFRFGHVCIASAHRLESMLTLW